MKKIALLKTVFILLIVFPEMIFAQWHMVRFDSISYFNKTFAITDNTMFVGGNVSVSANDFMLRTNNGGTSWDSIPLITGASSFNVVDIFFNSINEGFVGGLKNGRQLLIKTVDNGNSWNEITPDTLSLGHIRTISFINPQEGYVANQTSLYKTINGGANWTTLIPGFFIEKICFLDMNTGFASGELNSYGVVMKTADGGQTWNNVLTSLSPFFLGSTMDRLDVINHNELYSSLSYSNRMFRSVDGGVTWDTIDVPNIFEIQDFDFTDSNEGHLVSKMGEIFGTNDGGQNWTLEYAVSGGFYGPSIYLNSISFAESAGYVCASDGLIKKFTKLSSGIDIGFTNEKALMFPNPIQSGMTLFVSSIEGDYNLEIIDNIGKVVFYQKGKVSKNELISVNDFRLPQGIYNVLLTKGESTSSEKLIIVK